MFIKKGWIPVADKKQNSLKYGEVVSKCWEDETYRKRFIEDPETVLTEAGFVVEEGVTYKVIEQPKLIKYMVIPHDDSKEAVQVVAKGLLNAAEKKDVIIPAGAELRIIQNTEDIRYLILPMSPKSLTQAELKMVAGGDYLKVSSNVVGATNGALIAEGAAAVVEVEVASTTTTFEFEAEVGVGVVAVGVIVLI